jgi:hypothetical protein
VNLCSESGVSCTALPATANKAEYIRVKIVSHIPTTFAQVIGRDILTTSAEAVARAKISTSSSSSSFFEGAGMVATRSDNSNQCFLLNSGANLTLHDTGIFVNCMGTEAIFVNSGAKMAMGADAETVGCAKNQGGTVTGGSLDCGQTQQIIDASTFADVPRTLPAPTCSENGVKSGNTLSPGRYPYNIPLDSTATLTEGTYCFDGGVNMNGGASLKGTGEIKIVLGGDFNFSGPANTFEDLEIYTQNSTFSVKGSLVSPRLRFFATGSGGLNFQDGTVISTNAYFYIKSGSYTSNSNTHLHLHAPPQGDTFGGLLIYQPWENTNTFILNGNTGSVLTGTILVPHSSVYYNGKSEFELHGQIIGYTFIVNGETTDIYYNASENYQPAAPDNPTIELTQ